MTDPAAGLPQPVDAATAEIVELRARCDRYEEALRRIAEGPAIYADTDKRWTDHVATGYFLRAIARNALSGVAAGGPAAAPDRQESDDGG